MTSVTPKQKLLAHLTGCEHAGVVPTRGTLNQLKLWHRHAHKDRHVLHAHTPDGIADGEISEIVRITLQPPKNPSATRNQDRNWVLHIAHQGHGWRWEMAGTRDGDVNGAIAAADKMLGWEPNWAPVGWGFQATGDGQ